MGKKSSLKYLFFLFLMYLFIWRVGSWLRHMGSSFYHVRSSAAAQGLSGRSTWALQRAGSVGADAQA